MHNELMAHAQKVAELSVLFGPLTFAIVEFFVKPAIKDRIKRRIASGIIAALVPTVYYAYTEGLPWQSVPFIIVLTWLISQATHQQRNKNEGNL